MWKLRMGKSPYEGLNVFTGRLTFTIITHIFNLICNLENCLSYKLFEKVGAAQEILDNFRQAVILQDRLYY